MATLEWEEPLYALVADGDEVVMYCDHPGCTWQRAIHRHATLTLLNSLSKTHVHKLKRNPK